MYCTFSFYYCSDFFYWYLAVFITWYWNNKLTYLLTKAGQSPTCRPPGMPKCDCAFLTYLQTGMLLPPSEWNLQTRAQSILAHVDLPPMEMSHNISMVTGPKFSKFVAIVFFSSTALTQQSSLRSATRCRMRERLWNSNITKTSQSTASQYQYEVGQ